jgi:glycosyltransferase involved in cell wall biosynthesis
MTPPRVLVLTTYYHPVVGGVETHARQLVTYLRARGVPVQVVTKRIGRDEPRESQIDGVTVHRVGPPGERSAGGKWRAIPAFVAALLARASEYDVIVCVDYRGAGVAAVLAGAINGRPVIAQGETAGVLAGARGDSTSGLAPESPAVRVVKAPVRWIYRRADHIVCIGRDLEQEALRAGVPRDRVHYIPHGVDLQRFRPAASSDEKNRIRAALGWPSDRLVVLSVGRLSREKGVMDLLEAWRLVDGSALLTLVGPDMTGHPWDAGAPGRAFVESHRLGERVHFVGATEDPSPYYRAADVFVQPSHFEALGNTAIEAMASGLAVVASGVGGLADFCIDGQNTLLHTPRSPASLAAVLARALADAALRARLGEAARRTAVDRFELTALLDRYVQLIESTATAELLGRR